MMTPMVNPITTSLENRMLNYIGGGPMNHEVHINPGFPYSTPYPLHNIPSRQFQSSLSYGDHCLSHRLKQNSLASLTKQTHMFSQPGTHFGFHEDPRLTAVFNYEEDSEVSKKEIGDIINNIKPREGRANTPIAMKNPLFEHQKIALKWMTDCEEGSNKGGILADEMGLGKTISTLSLIASRKVAEDGTNRPTLIVGPVAIITQWMQEIKDKLRGTHALSMLMHHSKKYSYEELKDVDVVLTTYGIITSEWRMLSKHMSDHNLKWAEVESNNLLRKKCPLIHPRSKWLRVVLDEAHTVKNRTAKVSEGVSCLAATYRWCLTGTPMMNNVDELYPLLRFLKIKPHSRWEAFKKDFGSLTKGSKPMPTSYKQQALEKLRVCLAAVMLRRTKKSELDGKPIIQLPPKKEIIIKAELSADEASFYRSLESRNADKFNKYNREGTVQKNYAYILVLLLRLRQAVCHPHLNTDVEAAPEVELKSQQEAIDRLDSAAAHGIMSHLNICGPDPAAFQCYKCNDGTLNPIFFPPCGHSVCAECMSNMQANADTAEVGEMICLKAMCDSVVNLHKAFGLAAFKSKYFPNLLKNFGTGSEDGSDDDSGGDSDGENSKVKFRRVIDNDDDYETDSVRVPLKEATEGRGILTSDVTTPEPKSDLVTLEGFPKSEKGNETSIEMKANVSSIRDKKDISINVESSFEKEKEEETLADIKLAEAARHFTKKKQIVIRHHLPNEMTRMPKAKKASIKDVHATELGRLRNDAKNNNEAKMKYYRYLRKNWETSAKVDRAISLIKQIDKEKEKVIVFSNFTGLLDLMEIPLQYHERIKYERFDGSMSMTRREAALSSFRKDKNTRVLLVSMRAGNAGLNLTVANNVIIMDPFWNPFIEMQAVDRTHRMGQMKDVNVYRILVKETVEDRIKLLQDSKKELIDAALDEGSTATLQHLSAQQLGFLFGINS